MWAEKRRRQGGGGGWKWVLLSQDPFSLLSSCSLIRD